MKNETASDRLPVGKVSINDRFWSYYTALVRDTILPYQWDALNDRIPGAEPSYAVKNFKIAAGMETGEFYGMVFQDSDVAKWLEAVGYSLETHPDAELEKTADEMIDIIEKAQQPDGYLNTYFTVKEPESRWKNLFECHELYCAGHMTEAAVAYYDATGKRKLLDVMCRFADHIDTVFGPEPEKLKGYPGHQEIELALAKLYRVTKNERYLKLAKYFIDERGKAPSYFTNEWKTSRNKLSYWSKLPAGEPELAYNQSHLPVREQSAAVGHAVRAVYMYSGMADVAEEYGDSSLLDACRRIWEDVTRRQMYITGGIGSTYHGEAFTKDYDLPNDTVYAETCASIGLIFFARRMLRMDLNGDYADVMERALYNTVLAGLSRDGKSFFYVNPLEVVPGFSGETAGKKHVLPVRQKWFGCACCPPNISRLLTSLGQYIYSCNEDAINVHLYISSETEVETHGRKIRIKQETRYPWDGKISLRVDAEKPSGLKVRLRIPGWCRNWKAALNGNTFGKPEDVVKGYLEIDRTWSGSETVTLELEMPVEVMEANPQVRADAGKVALQRGPLVYCLEEADNGSNLSCLSISTGQTFTAEYEEDVLGGIVTLKGEGRRREGSGWDKELYRPARDEYKPVKIRAIPYYAWGNRTPGEMLVWIDRT